MFSEKQLPFLMAGTFCAIVFDCTFTQKRQRKKLPCDAIVGFFWENVLKVFLKLLADSQTFTA